MRIEGTRIFRIVFSVTEGEEREGRFRPLLLQGSTGTVRPNDAVGGRFKNLARRSCR